MQRLFDRKQLQALAEETRSSYEKSEPFSYAVFKNFLNVEMLAKAANEFPSQTETKWYRYDNPLEKKLGTPHIEDLPLIFEEIILQLNSAPFVDFLERLTGIENLIPDPKLNGGGLHQIQIGGKLDIHADYNVHPKYKLDRRVNVLIYLNKHWHKAWRGELELWDRHMTECQVSIPPQFNTMVIFNSTDTSFHGHPDPLECPPFVTRKSIALYYYTNGRPASEKSEPHSTLFKKRPQDPDSHEIEALRVKRSISRLKDIKE